MVGRLSCGIADGPVFKVRCLQVTVLPFHGIKERDMASRVVWPNPLLAKKKTKQKQKNSILLIPDKGIQILPEIRSLLLHRVPWFN